ncbi:iron transporter [Haloparvum alkalitolerans]|uniref:DUF7350 domain-containing protein n=1 Tax=Haloparvum alkalitolerans TaxID=1042953 RepID=UPI003CEB4FFB
MTDDDIPHEPTDDAQSPDRQTGIATRLTRRCALSAGAAGLAGALAGCAGDGSEADPGVSSPAETATEDTGTGAGGGPTLARVEDPPAAVYVPTHFEAMRHLDPIRAGPYEVVPMVTYPHAFWTVTGETVERTEPSGAEDVHLMVTVRDPETGAVIPAETGLELTVGREGESGSTHVPWPMVSQEMGLHAGDNVPLGEDGTYEVAVRVGAVDARLTGDYAGRFDESGTGTFTFTFDDEFRSEVVEGIVYVAEDDRGRRGALANAMALMGSQGTEENSDTAEEPHPNGVERWAGGEAGHRYGTYERAPDAGELPPADALPGTLQGRPVTGDAVLATTLVAAGSRFVDGDERYLAVSPRTPYNRSSLPMTALSYEQRRAGEAVSSGSLTATLDHELGYHYGAALSDARTGDAVTLTVDTPPQAARHAGYQTAFREMPPVEVELEVPE